MPQVYNFKKYDINQDRIVVSAAKATPERIAELGGELIEATGEIVAEGQLDGNGFYRGEKPQRRG